VTAVSQRIDLMDHAMGAQAAATDEKISTHLLEWEQKFHNLREENIQSSSNMSVRMEHLQNAYNLQLSAKEEAMRIAQSARSMLTTGFSESQATLHADGKAMKTHLQVKIDDHRRSQQRDLQVALLAQDQQHQAAQDLLRRQMQSEHEQALAAVRQDQAEET
jgi:hypothetical protein